jgi:hypothetical protein
MPHLPRPAVRRRSNPQSIDNLTTGSARPLIRAMTPFTQRRERNARQESWLTIPRRCPRREHRPAHWQPERERPIGSGAAASILDHVPVECTSGTGASYWRGGRHKGRLTNQAAILALFRVVTATRKVAADARRLPDYRAPVIRNTEAGSKMTPMRWGIPSPPRAGGPPVTNIRNTSSPHCADG